MHTFRRSVDSFVCTVSVSYVGVWGLEFGVGVYQLEGERVNIGFLIKQRIKKARNPGALLGFPL